MSLRKRDVKELYTRAISSLVLGIEIFNRPHSIGRVEAVLILLHHAFEMVLKAIIKDRTGKVHDKGQKYSYHFDKCLEISQNELHIISTDERLMLSVLDAHRDTAVHYYQGFSEDLLYVHAQASVTLFDAIVERAFGTRLADVLPPRVLPVSTQPPKDLELLLDSELSQVDELLKLGKRKGQLAAARLRPILAMVATVGEGSGGRVSEANVNKALAQRRKGKEWTFIIPEIAQIKIGTDGEGIAVYYKFSKDGTLPFRIAKPGEPAVGTIIKQEYDWYDKYNLSVTEIAAKLGLSVPKTKAYMYEIDVWSDPEMFGEKKIKSQVYRLYTKKALDALRHIITQITPDEIWEKHKKRVMPKKYN